MNRENLSLCVHVTSADKLSQILMQGLVPQIGALSVALETQPAVYLFPSWADLMDAQWLFEAWPHASEPALLWVDVRGLSLDPGADFEVVSLEAIEPRRIGVLAPGESDWDLAERVFYQKGGHALPSPASATFLESKGATPPAAPAPARHRRM